MYNQKIAFLHLETIRHAKKYRNHIFKKATNMTIGRKIIDSNYNDINVTTCVRG